MRASAVCVLALLLSLLSSSSLLLLCSGQAGGGVGSNFQSNAYLKSLVLSPGTMVPAVFNSSETASTLLLASNNDVVRVQTSMQAAGASHLFQLNGGDLFYRQAPADFTISVNGGVNSLKIISFAQDSTSRIDYQILIYKPDSIASDNANLLGVSFGGVGTVSPATFSSRTLVYTLTLASGSNPSTLSVTVTAADSNAYLQLIVGTSNAVTVDSGVARTVWLDPTVQTVRVNAIAQSARTATIYTFNILRSGAQENPTTGGGGVVGDPIFTSLEGGHKFQIHGMDSEIYNLISASNLCMNAQFVFLDRGDCPPPAAGADDDEEGFNNTSNIAHGRVRTRKSGDCWTHPGSYLGRISIQTRVALLNGDGGSDDTLSEAGRDGGAPTRWSALQRLLLEAGPAAKGFETVQLNGIWLNVGDFITLPFDAAAAAVATSTPNSTAASFVHFRSAWVVVVQLDGGTLFRLVSSDRFVNLQRVAFRTVEHKAAVRDAHGGWHGLLGQTLTGREYPHHKLRYTEGEDVDQYAVHWPTLEEKEEDRDRIWAHKFAFNKFITDDKMKQIEAVASQ